MRIGLTTRIDTHSPTSEVRASVDTNWINFLEPIASSIHVLQTFNSKLLVPIDNLDLVIFTGGNDLSAVSECELSSKRDRSEVDLLSECLQKDIPILGVCRGMQLLNHYFGGTTMNISNHVRTTHQVDIHSKWLQNINKVNSYHSWGLVSERLSPDLVVSATCSEDESIEAIEHKKHRVRGVMWHPERWTDNLGSRDVYLENQLKILEFNK